MKKYFAFAKVVLKEQFQGVADKLGTVFSFSLHIVIFSFLWDFVIANETMAGYTRNELIWYVIMAEAVLYSFHYYYRKVATKVEMGDFAYDMTKPYNFLVRTIVEGMADLPMTVILILTGGVLGIIFAGTFEITLMEVVICVIIMLMSAVILLLLNIIIGLLSIWLGRDVSSVWLLAQKAMLIFAFTPIEFFPGNVQKFLLLLPTTHVIYTPSSLFVHFSKEKCIASILGVGISFIVLSVVLFVIYKKGVKKQNVNGI